VSLNLGNDVMEAARSLREMEPWATVREGLLEAARRAMNTALETAGERTGDAIGYARALRDVYLALEGATTGQSLNRIEKPGPVERSRAR
jgi:sirohydrochlorin ferrochelatase